MGRDPKSGIPSLYEWVNISPEEDMLMCLGSAYQGICANVIANLASLSCHSIDVGYVFSLVLRL